jgi:glucose/arabinose dehydrogenase
MLITERPGRVRVVENGALRSTPFADLTSTTAAVGEGGLLGMAIDPNFAQNRLIYFYQTYRDAGSQLRNRIVRYRDSNGLTEGTTILDGIIGGTIHDGGRIRFGPDGKLYITTGDANQSSLSPNTGSLNGKILRISPDGSIPSDNPFTGSPVWTFGHRNVQGLDWEPRSGTLYATEHGPVGFDEVNRIEAGRNYGWPTVTGARGDARFVDPIVEYTPAIAPSGASFYNSNVMPCWQGDFFFVALRGTHLHRLDFDGSGRMVGEERLLENAYGRQRDVQVGPDGMLYVLTNESNGRLLRVSVACR